MNIFIAIILFSFGIFIVVKGSDWFVNSAVIIANSFGIPQIIIGATIISICTTMPETLVSVTAAFKGQTDMAVGNSLGSIAANIGIIMSIIFIFSKPSVKHSSDYLEKGIFLLIPIVLIWGVGFFIGEINRLTGFILLLLLILFLFKNISIARQSIKEADTNRSDKEKSSNSMGKTIILFIIGLALVILGAKLIVDNGIILAEIFKIPTFLISLIFISIGTSLPELVTVISSIRKKSIGLGIGNLLGANILNIVQVLGVSAMVTPIPLTHQKYLLVLQFPILLAMATVAVLFGRGQGTFKPWNGIVLLFLYLVFILSCWFMQ